MPVSLLTLPVELVYRILNNFNNISIFLSLTGVCERLNAIIHTYHPYQVNFSFIMKLAFHHLRNIIHLKKSHILPFRPLFNLMLDPIRKSSSILFTLL